VSEAEIFMMRSMVKLMLAMALVATSAAANAQIQDVNNDLGIVKHEPFDFSSDLDRLAPMDLEASTPGWAARLGRGTEAITFYGYEGYSGVKSPQIPLAFDVGPLGGARDLGARYEVIGIDGSFRPKNRCGQDLSRNSITCSSSVQPAGVPAAAPEVDSHFAVEGLLLLAGGLIVLRARRTPKAPTQAAG
jgi:hypothetical protein